MKSKKKSKDLSKTVSPRQGARKEAFSRDVAAYESALKNLMQNGRMAEMLGKAGRHGDTMVAHISGKEAEMLKAAGGAGTRNPVTGIVEFSPMGGQAGGSDGLGRGKSTNGGGGGKKGGKQGDLGISSGKMQHSVSPSNSTLSHMGGARNTTAGQSTKYDPDRKAGAILDARKNWPTANLAAKAIQGIGSLVPGPLGSLAGIGNMMGEDAEDMAPGNIDSLSPISGDPGGFSFEKNGRTYSNRAGYPGSDLDKRDKAPTSRSDKTEAAALAEERRKRRVAAQQTALGSAIDELGPGVLPI